MRRSAIAVAAAAAVLGLAAGCGGDDDEGDPEAGKAVFASAGCGGCHTLEEAGSSGSVGPKLDGLNVSYERVKEQVENGGGAMPPFKGQLTDQQIADVSAFVSQSSQS